LDGLLEEEAQFLGSIIIKWEEAAKGERKAVIIDSQQRITTISILIKALYDCIEKEKEETIGDARNALFYRTSPLSAEYHLSLQHSTFDFDSYQSVMGEVQKANESCPYDHISSPLKETKITINKETNRIKRCYRFFYETLSRMYKEEKEKVERLWCAIFGDQRELIVLIELERSEDEQKIFDTINSSGLKLSVSDIVKNAIYQRLMSFNINKEEVIEFYKKRGSMWLKMMRRKKSIGQWRKSEIQDI